MSMVIRIDDDVFKALQAKALELGIPFSTTNNMLRIALGLEPMPGERHKPKN